MASTPSFWSSVRKVKMESVSKKLTSRLRFKGKSRKKSKTARVLYKT
jgi:hypothetical protein